MVYEVTILDFGFCDVAELSRYSPVRAWNFLAFFSSRTFSFSVQTQPRPPLILHSVGIDCAMQGTLCEQGQFSLYRYHVADSIRRSVLLSGFMFTGDDYLPVGYGKIWGNPLSLVLPVTVPNKCTISEVFFKSKSP